MENDLTAIEGGVVLIVVCVLLAEPPFIRCTPSFGTALDYGSRGKAGEKGE